MDIKCKHVDMKKYKDSGLYIYHINSNQDVVLCEECNMELAGEIARQQAIEVFVHGPTLCSCKVCIDEEKRDDKEMLTKLKGGKMKNVKRRRRRKETGRKKGKD